MDPVELGARDIEASRKGAGGDQEAVVAEASIAFEQELVQAGVESGGSSRVPELDRVLGIEALIVDVGPALGLAAQVVLRERRALVGPLGLIADQDDAAVEAFACEGSRPPWRRPGRRRRSRMSDPLRSCLPFVSLLAPTHCDVLTARPLGAVRAQ